MAFVRDPVSKMVINNDDSHYQAILQARTAQQSVVQAEAELVELRAKVENMENDVHTLKETLKQFLAGNNNVKTSS